MALPKITLFRSIFPEADLKTIQADLQSSPDAEFKKKVIQSSVAIEKNLNTLFTKTNPYTCSKAFLDSFTLLKESEKESEADDVLKVGAPNTELGKKQKALIKILNHLDTVINLLPDCLEYDCPPELFEKLNDTYHEFIDNSIAVIDDIQHKLGEAQSLVLKKLKDRWHQAPYRRIFGLSESAFYKYPNLALEENRRYDVSPTKRTVASFPVTYTKGEQRVRFYESSLKNVFFQEVIEDRYDGSQILKFHHTSFGDFELDTREAQVNFNIKR